MIATLLAIAVFALLTFVAAGLDTRWRRRHTLHKMQEIEMRAQSQSPQDSNAAVEELRALLRSDYWFARLQAVMVLGKIGKNASPAIADMEAALYDDNLYVQRQAMFAIKNLGHIAFSAKDAAMERVRTAADRDVGWFAAEFLGEIADSRDTEVREVLNRGAKSNIPPMRDACMKALSRIAARSSQEDEEEKKRSR